MGLFAALVRNKLDSTLGKESYKSVRESIKEVIKWMKEELNA